MQHGGEIYDKKVELDFSVSLNPLPCPRQVRQALRRAEKDISNYPDQKQDELRRAIAYAENSYSLTPENVLCGNGSSELLAALIRYLNPSHVLLPVPGFSGYPYALSMLENCRIEELSLERKTGFRIGPALLNRITEKTELLILTNPNNPTGKFIEEELLHSILERCRETGTNLIVDECFLRLSKTARSLRGEVENYTNLYVLDSYTKLFSIPGVRIGFLFSSHKNIDAVKRFLPEWNLSAYAVRAGITCARMLLDGSFLQHAMREIRKELTYLRQGLRALGFSVLASDTVFLLFYSHIPLYEPLLSRGILIRDCGNLAGLKEGYYRIAVKDHASNRRLLTELRRIV